MLRSVGGSARVTGAQRRGESASETAQGEGALVWEGGRSYSFRFSGRSSSQAEIWKVNVDVPEERRIWKESRQPVQRLRDQRKHGTL